MRRDGNVAYCCAVLDRLSLSAVGLSHQENGGVTGHSAGDHEMLRLLIFSHGFDALRASLCMEYCLILPRGFENYGFILMGGTLWILPIPAGRAAREEQGR